VRSFWPKVKRSIIFPLPGGGGLRGRGFPARKGALTPGSPHGYEVDVWGKYSGSPHGYEVDVWGKSSPSLVEGSPLAMTSLSPEQCRQALTSSQRLVLDSFEYSWGVLTIKDIRKETKEKISVKTIRRALKKLCDMGIIERLPAEKLGRGYSNLYKLKEE
jgi:hypothetical protein